jgi:hypothetical protein
LSASIAGDDNDKLGSAGPLGVALYFDTMGFCNRNLIDGFFPKTSPAVTGFRLIGTPLAELALHLKV